MRREANGQYTHLGPIGVTNSPAGTPRKEPGIAVDASGRIHIMWGRDGENAYYSSSTDGVNWAAAEPVPWDPTNSLTSFSPALGVTSAGAVFVGWVDRVTDPNGDIKVAQRLGPGNWVTTDISPGLGYAHSPAFAADNSSGLRVAWDDDHATGLASPLTRRMCAPTTTSITANGCRLPAGAPTSTRP